MATETQDDIPVTTQWVDIVNDGTVGNAALSNADCAIQNKCNAGEIYIVFGGSQPAENSRDGTVLGRRESAKGNNSNIWVRGPAGGQTDDVIGVTLL